MNNKPTLDALVQARMRELSLSQQALCKRAGISRQTLYAMLNVPGTLPSLQTVMALAGALGMHPIRLLQVICDEHAPAWATRTARQGESAVDASAFVQDISFADGERVFPGQRFLKTWELQNVGDTVWQARFIQCMDDDITVLAGDGTSMRIAQRLSPTQSRIPLPTTGPGQTVRVSAEFLAPDAPGTVVSYWKAVFADGQTCFPEARGLWVKVQVVHMRAAEGPLPGN